MQTGQSLVGSLERSVTRNFPVNAWTGGVDPDVDLADLFDRFYPVLLVDVVLPDLEKHRGTWPDKGVIPS